MEWIHFYSLFSHTLTISNERTQNPPFTKAFENSYNERNISIQKSSQYHLTFVSGDEGQVFILPEQSAPLRRDNKRKRGDSEGAGAGKGQLRQLPGVLPGGALREDLRL